MITGTRRQPKTTYEARSTTTCNDLDCMKTRCISALSYFSCHEPIASGCRFYDVEGGRDLAHTICPAEEELRATSREYPP